MQHRDKIILQKIISEIEIGTDIVGELSPEEYQRDEAFGNSGISEVNIPKLMKVIGFSSFKSCWSLPYVSVPENVEEIRRKYKLDQLDF